MKKFLVVLLAVLLSSSFVYAASGKKAKKKSGDRAVVVSAGSGVTASTVGGENFVDGSYWALIIGINKYQGRNVPKLTTAVADAKGVRDVLMDRYGFTKDHIIELYDDKATGVAIKNSFFKLTREVGENDSLFIYYAGHGQFDTKSRMGWWIPVEGEADSPGTFIDNPTIINYISGISSRHTYLVSDSCFSGTLFGTSRSLPPLDDKFYKTLYNTKSRWGFTSGNAQPVSDGGKDGHSIFAYHLIKELKENGRPYLIPSQIFDQVAPVVANNSDQLPVSQPLKQTGDEGGQFVFRLASYTPPVQVVSDAVDGAPGVSRPTKKLPVVGSDAPGGPQVFAPSAEDLAMSAEEARLQAELDIVAADKAAVDAKQAEGAKKADKQKKLDELKAKLEAEKKKLEEAKKPKPVLLAKADGGTSTINQKDGYELVYIPAGEFMMGSPDGEGSSDEHPRHSVYLDGYSIGKYEVSVGQFRQFVDATGYRTDAEKEGWSYGIGSDGNWGKQDGLSWRNPGFSQGDSHPVVCVSWNDAKAYCDWAGLSLPTEAQWEKAARGKTDAKFWWGSGNPVNKTGNFADESAKRKFSGWTIMDGYDDGYVYTAPVGSFQANGYGLYDTAGNAWEWCSDWYGDSYYASSPGRNPGGPSTGQSRALRGGSWVNSPVSIRSALRDRFTPGSRSNDLGFRPARTSQ